MSGLVERCIARLEREGIPCCHWKGAAALERGLVGERDLDFLVSPDAFARTAQALCAEGFKAARSRFGAELPGTAHFFGHEPGRERLLHVHLHDRVLSGEDLVPSHVLPLARALLASPARAHGVRVPTPAQEAALAVLKHALRWGSRPDRVLTWLRPKDERAELARLLIDANLDAAFALLGAQGVALDETSFRACARALRDGSSRSERLRLAASVGRALRPFARQNALARRLAYARLLAARGRRLLDGNRPGKALAGPARVIAFVGGDGEARAAFVAEVARWLGQAFAVRRLRGGRRVSSTPGEIVLVDGEPVGRAADLRLDLAESRAPELARARVWAAL